MVVGRVSIFLPEAVSQAEAFEHLSTALASNGFGISKQGDTMVVKRARHIQRDLIEVTNQLPDVKPQRMVTYIYEAKNIPVDDINREIRILTSTDGEIVPHNGTNQILITDWTPNLARIDQILRKIDVKPGSEAAAQVEIGKKRHAERNENFHTSRAKDKKGS
jgi:type II secretory pathway component GspD/PulD (secretin)